MLSIYNNSLFLLFFSGNTEIIMLTLTEISEELISKIHEIEKQQYFSDAQRTGKFIIDFEKHVEPILNDEISKNNIKIDDDDDDGRFDDKIEKMDIASLIKKTVTPSSK